MRPTRFDYFALGRDVEYGPGEFFEHLIRCIYTHQLQPGDVVVDGGANRGRHTFPLADMVGQEGLVVAVEALPRLASNLKKRSEDENKLQIYVAECALTHEMKRVQFHDVSASDGYSGLRLKRHLNDALIGSVKKVNVWGMPFDQIWAGLGYPQVRFVKLDLEGGEYHALLGAKQMMTVASPLIVFESGRQLAANLYNYEAREWYDMFYSRNYQIFDLFGEKFDRSCWSVEEMPWYLVAAKRAVDVEFCLNQLEPLCRDIYQKIKASR